MAFEQQQAEIAQTRAQLESNRRQLSSTRNLTLNPAKRIPFLSRAQRKDRTKYISQLDVQNQALTNYEQNILIPAEKKLQQAQAQEGAYNEVQRLIARDIERHPGFLVGSSLQNARDAFAAAGLDPKQAEKMYKAGVESSSAYVNAAGDTAIRNWQADVTSSLAETGATPIWGPGGKLEWIKGEIHEGSMQLFKPEVYAENLRMIGENMPTLKYYDPSSGQTLDKMPDTITRENIDLQKVYVTKDGRKLDPEQIQPYLEKYNLTNLSKKIIKEDNEAPTSLWGESLGYYESPSTSVELGTRYFGDVYDEQAKEFKRWNPNILTRTVFPITNIVDLPVSSSFYKTAGKMVERNFDRTKIGNIAFDIGKIGVKVASYPARKTWQAFEYGVGQLNTFANWTADKLKGMTLEQIDKLNMDIYNRNLADYNKQRKSSFSPASLIGLPTGGYEEINKDTGEVIWKSGYKKPVKPISLVEKYGEKYGSGELSYKQARDLWIEATAEVSPTTAEALSWAVPKTPLGVVAMTGFLSSPAFGMVEKTATVVKPLVPFVTSPLEKWEPKSGAARFVKGATPFFLTTALDLTSRKISTMGRSGSLLGSVMGGGKLSSAMGLYYGRGFLESTLTQGPTATAKSIGTYIKEKPYEFAGALSGGALAKGAFAVGQYINPLTKYQSFKVLPEQTQILTMRGRTGALVYQNRKLILGKGKLGGVVDILGGKAEKLMRNKMGDIAFNKLLLKAAEGDKRAIAILEKGVLKELAEEAGITKANIQSIKFRSQSGSMRNVDYTFDVVLKSTAKLKAGSDVSKFVKLSPAKQNVLLSRGISDYAMKRRLGPSADFMNTIMLGRAGSNFEPSLVWILSSKRVAGKYNVNVPKYVQDLLKLNKKEQGLLFSNQLKLQLKYKNLTDNTFKQLVSIRNQINKIYEKYRGNRYVEMSYNPRDLFKGKVKPYTKADLAALERLRALETKLETKFSLAKSKLAEIGKEPIITREMITSNQKYMTKIRAELKKAYPLNQNIIKKMTNEQAYQRYLELKEYGGMKALGDYEVIRKRMTMTDKAIAAGTGGAIFGAKDYLGNLVKRMRGVPKSQLTRVSFVKEGFFRGRLGYDKTSKVLFAQGSLYDRPGIKAGPEGLSQFTDVTKILYKKYGTKVVNKWKVKDVAGLKPFGKLTQNDIIQYQKFVKQYISGKPTTVYHFTQQPIPSSTIGGFVRSRRVIIGGMKERSYGGGAGLDVSLPIYRKGDTGYKGAKMQETINYASTSYALPGRPFYEPTKIVWTKDMARPSLYRARGQIKTLVAKLKKEYKLTDKQAMKIVDTQIATIQSDLGTFHGHESQAVITPNTILIVRPLDARSLSVYSGRKYIIDIKTISAAERAQVSGLVQQMVAAFKKGNKVKYDAVQKQLKIELKEQDYGKKVKMDSSYQLTAEIEAPRPFLMELNKPAKQEPSKFTFYEMPKVRTYEPPKPTPSEPTKPARIEPPKFTLFELPKPPIIEPPKPPIREPPKFPQWEPPKITYEEKKKKKKIGMNRLLVMPGAYQLTPTIKNIAFNQKRKKKVKLSRLTGFEFLRL